VIDSTGQRSYAPVAGPTDHGERPLGRCRKEGGRRKNAVDLFSSAEAGDSSHRQHDRLDLPGSDEPNPRVDVSSDLGHPEVGAPAQQLGPSPEAARPDLDAPRQYATPQALRYDEAVPRVRAAGAGEELEARVQLGRKVFGTVNGDIHFAAE
jgi:hypothetical protein